VNGRKNDLAAKGAHAELRLLANRLHGWRSGRRRTRTPLSATIQRRLFRYFDTLQKPSSPSIQGLMG